MTVGSATRREVTFKAHFPAGSIVVVNKERHLYLVGERGTATRYPIAVGSLAEDWTGVEFVSDRKVNPTWVPVAVYGEPPKPATPGGDPANPLGPRALYLGRTLWRIHGTPAPTSIGAAVSNGCIRMHNEHIVDLYERVMIGTEVYVVNSLSDPVPVHRGRKMIDTVARDFATPKVSE